MGRNKAQIVKKNRVLLGGGFLLLLAWYFCLPEPLFKEPTSTVMLDRNRELLGAKIAEDMQWRFPARKTVPLAFQQSITTFEDQRFFYHPGVDPFALLRAIYQNISRGKVVSGASTLSMQVIRLSRKGQSRTFWEKCIEIIWATRLEWRYSKQDILALYASNAPFGGNIVGLDAAAWKYFGRSPEKLSWAETATLAVLPNAPGLIHPGRNRTALEEKRNRLLSRLVEKNVIDSLTCYLAQQEPIPGSPKPLPSLAPHLLERLHARQNPAKLEISSIHSTIDLRIQQRANQIVDRYHRSLKRNSVHNIAALIVSVETGEVISYVGNTSPVDRVDHGHAVDIITAPRSSGSILKPLLYASMLHDGELLPRMLIPDIPSFYNGYVPVNYNQTYAGSIPADQALARSLNIPAVRMLHEYGIPRFYDRLKDMGLTTLHRPPGDYGLTLILGGAEVNLEDLCKVYAAMARTLVNYQDHERQYDLREYRPLRYIYAQEKSQVNEDALQLQGKLSAAAIWLTFEAMLEVSRPETERYWQHFSSSQKIAWKTGTSFGARDAWAVGCTPEYVVGVWVGNADGEGRPGLTGIHAAAPVMFDLFNTLPASNTWFDQPQDELLAVDVCKHSGYLASTLCPEIQQLIPYRGQETLPCPYHKTVWLDHTHTYRVHSECESPSLMEQKSWFVLPPVEAYYYKSRHPDYKVLPPYRSDCMYEGRSLIQGQSMELMYPRHAARIYVPINLDGQPSSTVFEVAHRHDDTPIHWHLDQTFLGTTREIHQMALNPNPGKHILTWVDQWGETLTQEFEVISDNR